MMPEPRSLQREVEDLFAARRWADLEARLGELGDPELEARPELAFALAAAEFHRGALPDAERHARGAHVAFRRQGDHRRQLRALNWLAAVLFERGDLKGAEEGFSEVLDEAAVAGIESLAADAANNLGAVWSLRGEPERALSFYQLCIPLYQKLGDSLNLARAYHNLGIVYRDAGHLDRSAAYFEKAEERAKAMKDGRLAAMALAGRADLAHRRGDAAVAARLAERALRDSTEADDPLGRCDALRILGVVAAARGKIEQGLRHLDEAHALAHGHGHRQLEAEVLRERGALKGALSEKAAGYADLEAARALFAEIGAEREQERTDLLLAEWSP